MVPSLGDAMVQKIGIQVEVNSNIKSETQDANKFNEALKRAAQTAKTVNVGAGAPAGGGTAGSQRAAQMSQPVLAAQTVEYGRARGSAGATGASARDFANQSQGLGGLVRLYATYAANVFAVGAAFRALSSAMDTANMVRGLDQIGAASGVALGGLSRQLVAATGGAISLREAMSATVKVTAAGLGSENVLRLGTVAAKASQALGVDLNDAVNRLSRGITKLEPELLDELGIFTKIEPAVEKYALSIGKSAGSLTDFQRRQAFANAVLTEAETKFAAIKVDANPYNKLAAALQNTAQNGLELVNKVLAPIVNFLSESPAGLLTVLGGIGLALVRQVVPAFGQFRQSLQKASQEANAVALARAKDSLNIQNDLRANLKQIAETTGDAALLAFEKAEAGYKKYLAGVKKFTGQGESAINRILGAKDAFSISDKDINTALAQAQKDIAQSQQTADPKLKKALEERSAQIKNIANTAKEWKERETEALGVAYKISDQFEKDAKNKLTIIGINKSLADSIEKADFKRQIISNAAYNGSLIGVGNAIKLMRAQIDQADVDIGKFSRGLLIARGSLAAFGGAVATVASFINGALGAVGLIAGVLALLSTAFSNTARESKTTGEALGILEQNTKNLNNTIDVINKKPFLEQFNTQSVVARSNALDGLATSIQKVVKASEVELSRMNWIDSIKNGLSKIWGGDVLSKATEEVSRGLAAAFSDAATANSEAGKAASKALETILGKGFDLADFDKINAALSRLSSKERVIALEEIARQTSNLSKAAKEPAVALQGLEEAFKKISDASQKFISSILPKDAFFELGQGLVSVSFELENALKNPQTQLETIKKLFENIKNVPVGKDLFLGLQEAKEIAEDLQALTVQVNSYNQEVKKATDEQTRLNNIINSAQQARANRQPGVINVTDLSIANRKLKEVNQELERLKGSSQSRLNLEVEIKQKRLDALGDAITGNLEKVFDTGATVMATKISGEFSKAGAVLAQNLASAFGNTEAGIKLKAEADKQMIAAQLAQIDAVTAQIKVQQEGNLIQKEANLIKLEEMAQTMGKNQDLVGLDTYRVIPRIEAAKLEITRLKQALEGKLNFRQAQGIRAGEIAASRQNPALQQSITPDIINFTAQLEAARASRANLEAQISNIEYNAALNLVKLENERELRTKQAALEALKASDALLSSNKAINSETNESALLARQQSQEVIDQAEAALRRLQIEQEIGLLVKNQAEAVRQGRKDTAEQADRDIQNVRNIASAAEKAFNIKREDTRLKNAIDLVKVRSANEVKANELAFAGASRLLQIQDDALDRNRERLELDKQRFQLTQSFVIQQEAEIKRAEVRQRAAKDLLEAERIRRTEEQATETKRQQLLLSPDTGDGLIGPAQVEAINELNQASTKTAENYKFSVNRTKELLINQLANIDAQTQLNLKQEQYNKLFETAQSVAENIKNAFQGLGASSERIGNALSSFTTSFVDFAVNSEKASKNIESLNKASADAEIAGNYKLAAKYSEQAGEATKKQQKDEISGYAKIAGAAKGLFKEKTTAYKLLAATEKALHIARLAMDAKELFTKLTSIKLGVTADIAGEVKETATTAAGAAARAPITITEIFGKITSQLGVFGPPIAAVIVASIFGALAGGKSVPVIGAEQRQAVQGTAMGYNQAGEKVQVRSGVFGDVDAKSESIANSLEIIKNNSVAGLEYNNKLLKAFERLNRNIENVALQAYGQPGLTRGPVPGVVEGTVDTRKTKEGFALGAVVGLLGGPFGAILGGIVGSLFGKKVTKDVVDSGIKLKGSFLDLARAAEGSVEGFATVKTTTKRSFRKARVSVEDIGLEIDPKLAQAVTDAFGSALDTVYATAEILGTDLNTIDNKLASLDLTGQVASLRGLKGEEQAQALQAFFGSIIDEAFEIGFEGIAETYRKFGEGAAETIVRVADTNRKIEQVLGNLINGPALNLGLEVTEALATAAGGLDKFLGYAESFVDEFLTEEEKLGPTRRAVETELERLGLSSIKTRAQFKQVVQTLINTGQAGTETFVSLMKLSEGFAQVTQSAEKTNDALRSAYDARVSELKGARDEFQNFAKSLREYQLSLKTSNLSPLTPLEQYRELRAEFLKTRELAQRGDISAIGKLQSISQNFLQSSQRMYASSDEYISDFQLVSQTIDQTASVAELQVDIANNTLTEIKNAVTGLVELKDSVDKLPVALTGLGESLTTALTAAQQAANGDIVGTIPVVGGDVANIQAIYEVQRQADAAATAAKAAADAAKAAADAAAAIVDNGVAGGYSGLWDMTNATAATGAAFDYGGVRKFASGGIVNKLTPFSYSSGLGVMGEAGPEAIMPLRRTPSGNLGVIGMAAGNGDMIRELARLNQQVETLTRAVAEGAVINAQATDRNTEAVVEAVSSSSDNANYQIRLKDKVQVV